LDLPIKETDPFEARDAYSVSRIQSVYAARYFRTLGVKAYFGYFFNHDSPRRSERHMAQKIAAYASRLSKGMCDEKLSIGDLSVVKEWTFAGDVVNGIWLLINQDDIFEANISSGEGHSILDWTALCFSLVGADYRDHVIEATGFKAEYKQLVSDNSIIRSLGFKTEIDLPQLAKMMIHGS
jgi:GDPmannose 4,6-dehydratase